MAFWVSCTLFDTCRVLAHWFICAWYLAKSCLRARSSWVLAAMPDSVLERLAVLPPLLPALVAGDHEIIAAQWVYWPTGIELAATEGIV